MCKLHLFVSLLFSNTKIRKNGLTHFYRTLPFGQEIYTSARDIGNIAAGIVAAKNGIPWRDARIAFDVYQGGREGISTQNAEYYGWSQTYTHINGITEMSNLRNSIISSVKKGWAKFKNLW